jgi:hypothetical protein
MDETYKLQEAPLRVFMVWIGSGTIIVSTISPCPNRFVERFERRLLSGLLGFSLVVNKEGTLEPPHPHPHPLAFPRLSFRRESGHRSTPISESISLEGRSVKTMTNLITILVGDYIRPATYRTSLSHLSLFPPRLFCATTMRVIS